MIPLRHTVPSGTVETCFVPPKDKGSELTLKPSCCSVSSRVRSKTFPPGKPASILNGCVTGLLNSQVMCPPMTSLQLASLWIHLNHGCFVFWFFCCCFEFYFLSQGLILLPGLELSLC